MSTYDDVMSNVWNNLTHYRIEHQRSPSLIELSDADYDSVVALATYYDADAKTGADAKHYDLAIMPREGGHLYGVPVRADSALRRGHVKVS